jgi:hypothetical protein
VRPSAKRGAATATDAADELSRLVAKLADIRVRLQADAPDRDGKREILADIAQIEDDLEQSYGTVERHLATEPELQATVTGLSRLRDEVLDQLVRIRVALTSRAAIDLKVEP